MSAHFESHLLTTLTREALTAFAAQDGRAQQNADFGPLLLSTLVDGNDPVTTMHADRCVSHWLEVIERPPCHPALFGGQKEDWRE